MLQLLSGIDTNLKGILTWEPKWKKKTERGLPLLRHPCKTKISLSIKRAQKKKANTVCSAVSFWELGRTKLQNKCPFAFPAPRAEGSLENCLFLAQVGVHDLFIVPEMSDISLTVNQTSKRPGCSTEAFYRPEPRRSLTAGRHTPPSVTDVCCCSGSLEEG